jgi:hypothetical protein
VRAEMDARWFTLLQRRRLQEGSDLFVPAACSLSANGLSLPGAGESIPTSACITVRLAELSYDRFARKNSLRRAPHSAARTPAVTLTW